MRLPATFASLRTRNFRWYFSGTLVSNTGTWMQRVAQDWLVLQLTHGSGTALGITTGLQFLPVPLLGVWGGVIADRYPKRRVLYVTQTLIGVLALVLGILDLTNVVTVGHVYALALALGMVTAVDNPARQSFVIEMVGRERLTNAVGLNSASFNAARILGPAVAGLLITVIGTGWVFVVNAVSSAAVVGALAAMRASELRPAPRQPKEPGQLRDGLRYLRARPDLLVVMGIVFFVATFGLNFQMTIALMATHVFHRGAGQYGLLGSAMAVGSLTGALLAARRKQPTLALIVAAATAFGLAESAAALMPTYLAFMVALPFAGLASLTLLTSANATMQLGVDAAMRGRVMAVYMVVFLGGTPIGAPLVGWLGQHAGARWSLLGGGLISLAAALGGAAVVLRSGIASFAWRRRMQPAADSTVESDAVAA